MMIMRDGKVMAENIAEMQVAPQFLTSLPKKPLVYFDAVRLGFTLENMAFDAQQRAWRLQTALRNVRLADCDSEMTIAATTLEETYKNILDEEPNAKVAMLVDDLANQIDVMAPPNPKGYAAKPLRAIIDAIRNVFPTQGGVF